MLMAWGGYVFEMGAMAFDKLTRQTKARWKDHEIIGRRPAGQYLGPDKCTLTISGVTFPNDDGAGAAAQVAALEAACLAGEVYCLVTGSGSVSGPSGSSRSTPRRASTTPTAIPEGSATP